MIYNYAPAGRALIDYKPQSSIWNTSLWYLAMQINSTCIQSDILIDWSIFALSRIRIRGTKKGLDDGWITPPLLGGVCPH